MASVLITKDAQAAFNRLPLPIQRRMRGVFIRLAAWPQVSGAKPLRKELVGNYPIRTGDYRVVFRVDGPRVVVWKIGDCRDIYLD